MASPTVHMMWKEYRTLRPLWLAFVGMTAAILLALVVARIANAADVTTDDWPSIAIAGLAFPTLLFVPIALCLLFAVETEERTSQLLFQLSPTWRQLMVGKLLPVMIATAALWISLLAIEMLAALLLWLTSSGVTNVSSLSRPVCYVATEPLRIVALGILGCLWLTVPALLWSFVSRRVITAVLCTLLSMWILTSVVVTIGQYSSQLSIVATASLATLCSAMLVTALSVLWHRGLLPRKRQHVNEQAPDAAFSTEQSHATSFDGWWLWRRTSGILSARKLRFWLKGISHQQHSTWRMASALLWKEARCSLPVLVGWLAAGLALALVAQSSDIRFRAGLMTAFASLFCLELGLRTFRQEYSDGTLLFAVERGVAPALIWCTKVAFGLLSVVACTWLVITFDSLIPASDSVLLSIPVDQRPLGSISYSLSRLEQVYPPMDAGFGFLDANQIPWTMAVTCFVIGLISSAWIRRSVLSFGMGISLVTAMWLLVVPGIIKYDLPLLRLLGPVIGLWAATSLLTVRQTTELRQSTRLTWLRISMLVLPAMVAFAASGWIRMNQVPADVAVGNPVVFGVPASKSPHFPWYRLNDAAPDDAAQRLISQSQHGDSAQIMDRSNPWLQLGNSRSTIGMTSYSHRFDQPAYIEVTMVDSVAGAGSVTPRIDSFNRLCSLTESDAIAAMPLQLQTPWSVLPSMTIAECAIQNARLLMAEEKFADAATSLVDGVRLIRVVNQMSANWDQWATNCLAERTVLREVAAWAARDQISEDLLRATYLQMSDIMHDELSPAAMLRNRYFFMVASLWNPHVQTLEQRTGIEHWTRWQQTPATEKSRFVRLLQLITRSGLNEFGTEADVSEIANTPDGISGMPGLLLTARLLQTSPDFGLYLEDELALTGFSSHPSQHQQTLWSTATAERAALLILELQTWRRRHGSFPEQLQRLTNDDWTADFPRGQAELPMRPFFVPGTGQVFGYSPGGIADSVKVTEPNGDVRIIPSNQPMLWSNGQPEAVSFATRNLLAHRWLAPALQTPAAQDAQTSGTAATISFEDHTLRWEAADPSLIQLNW